MNSLDLTLKTPYLAIDLDRIKEAYDQLQKHLKGIDIHYAMKCNPNPEIMKTVLDCGGHFEIASADEMERTMNVGAEPKNMLFSNPVKTLDDIKKTFQTGVDYFSFDSTHEVDKLAEGAPGAKVYVRLAIPVRKSAVASEGKFGVSIEHARDLMVYANKCGLEPCGISFHVGTQMLDCESWGYAIQHSAKLMSMLEKEGIQLTLLNIGGGFPVCYEDVCRDNLDKIGNVITKAIKKYIPESVKVVAEPGRYLVANAGTMVSTVIGIAERLGRKWLHLDVGAFNGFMESLETTNNLVFPVYDSKKSNNKDLFTLTGPTCDSQDTILFDVPISSNIEIGDKVFLECAGAYTTTYTGNFNGFPSPDTYFLKTRKG